MAIKRYSTGENVPAHTWPVVDGETYVHAEDYDALQSLNAELLEALDKAIPALELYHAYGWPDFHGVINQCALAISKARSAQ